MFLDWLSFTFKVLDKNGKFKPDFGLDCQALLEAYGLGDMEFRTLDLLRLFKRVFVELNDLIENAVQFKGQLHGYGEVWVLDEGLMLMYNLSRPDMGIHVSASSTGLATLLPALGFSDDVHQVDLTGLFRFLRGRYCEPSRIDLTYDDHNKRMMPMDVFNARHERCALVSSTRAFNVVFNGGVTFYLGKRSSERMLRVYDKAVESKGQNDSVRWELEFKGKFCKYLFNYIADHPDEVTFGALLLDYMCIKEGSYDYELNELGIRVPTHKEMDRRKKQPLDPVFAQLLEEMQAKEVIFNRQIERVSYLDRKENQEKCGRRKGIQKTLLAMSEDEAKQWIFDEILQLDGDDLKETVEYLNTLDDEARKKSLYYKYFVVEERLNGEDDEIVKEEQGCRYEQASLFC